MPEPKETVAFSAVSVNCFMWAEVAGAFRFVMGIVDAPAGMPIFNEVGTPEPDGSCGAGSVFGLLSVVGVETAGA
ncbi:hypothetical protein KSZ_75480 [Dictyobacter formicarum]|uniref:Uncharacterized protein n=1 Tax=Dictyobacter formicarum TaxID=2778368 RepID=A0ABQ3VUJ0_9CHLR|nr:hypothetical protein KSZ_75480 [Dictyobacter formicarum]